jgi:hypothetical protein
MEDVHTSE